MDGATIITTIVSAVTSIVVTLVTFFATYKWTKKLERGAEERKELERRLDPHLNVRREYKTSTMSFGLVRSHIWLINPYWVQFSGESPRVRAWPDFVLEQRVASKQRISGHETDDVPFRQEEAEIAMRRKEWLKFTEYPDQRLVLWETEPVDAADAFLFQPLPQGGNA